MKNILNLHIRNDFIKALKSEESEDNMLNIIEKMETDNVSSYLCFSLFKNRSITVINKLMDTLDNFDLFDSLVHRDSKDYLKWMICYAVHHKEFESFKKRFLTKLFNSNTLTTEIIIDSLNNFSKEKYELYKDIFLSKVNLTFEMFIDNDYYEDEVLHEDLFNDLLKVSNLSATNNEHKLLKKFYHYKSIEKYVGKI